MAIGATWRAKVECREANQSTGVPNHANGMSFEHSVSPFAIGMPKSTPPASLVGNPEQVQGSHGEAHAVPPQSSKKRRPSKTKAPIEIRRSASTPHMRNLAQVDAGSVSPTTDKRRNKLGYHRTSVACGHCRRRKIRCQLAPDDPHGRCSQCLRLKKECNFYPVDQQAPSERTQASASKSEIGSGAPSTSTSSSPRGQAIPEHPNDYSSYPQLASNIPTHSLPHSSTGPMSNPSYSYQLSVDNVGWTASGYTSETPVSEELSTESSSSGYWNPSQPAASSAFQNGPVGPSGQMSSSTDFYRQPQEQTYGPPARSLSYGNIENLIPQQYANAQQDYRRPVPYSYPPLDTSTTAIGGPVSGVMSAPVGAPYSNYTYQQPWSPYTPIAQRADPNSPNVFPGSQFYPPEALPLGKVDEEQSIQYGITPSYYPNPQTSG